MIARAAAWSLLGAWTPSGVLPKATAPTRSLLGSRSMNRLAALSAAGQAVCATSVAAIDPEWSVTSTNDAWLVDL